MRDCVSTSPESSAAPVQRDPGYLDELIGETEAAKFLKAAVRTLQGWRVKGNGPAFVRLSPRAIRYTRRGLIAHSESKLVASTSDPGQEAA